MSLSLTACKRTLLGAAMMLPAAEAPAHFLLQYTDETIIERPGELPVSLIFWHPWQNGLVMEMARPNAFYVIQRGERTDLLDTLQPFSFQGAENSATAWRGTVPIRRSGDYLLVTEPVPYYEATEDKYIQQFTKVVLNRSTLPTDWADPVGLPAEILPLTKPYNVMAGSSFTGRVMADGQPVAGAEIEVEYMAALPEGDRAGPPSVRPPPGGAMVVTSDANGYFTFAVPRAGHWGFAALDIGPVKEHEGKPLSQDAVLWIRAWDME